MKKVLVIGATGLVGSQLVDLLLADERFVKIKVFTRRSTGINHLKFEEYIVDFNQPAQWQHLLTGDVLFSTLGTTLKKAGSKPAQYKIDYTYQYSVAKAAAANGVANYVLVSSAGASVNSKIFYSRMKGELEQDIAKLSFQHIHIIQPGILTGPRKENRTGEKIGISLAAVLAHIPGLTAYKPIPARTVAQAMINASLDNSQPLQVYTLQKVFDLAQRVAML